MQAQSDAFKNYIIGSPVIEDTLFDFESPALKTEKTLNANVFISLGENETSEIEEIRAFIAELKARNYKGLSLKYLVIESADHTTAFPYTGVRSVDWLSKLSK